ncbi:DUF4153 domain-containing protein [Actomonas aquatica]|uniref:DUF4153 domain-containing protein n=1 Tax=Actomonas aquatica TaxID=2866162 RepID=A0ABZ1C6M1_9BACT|nr:DUF4153 domain-containing protein [Opitutus sp. WL0086]WRQ87048.1 DUF4153 domain-containing protein [Opitutus sp. WL0086]
MRLADRIRSATTTAVAVARRFPASVFLSVAATLCAWLALEDAFRFDADYLWRAMFGCLLGLPFTVAVTLAVEDHPNRWFRFLPGLGLLISAACTVRLVTLPDPIPATEAFRLTTLSLASHFSVAVLPFLRRPGDDAYWAFQVRLFLRFLLGALYAGVLFGGLALALLSVDRLLELDIDDERYGQLWFFMAGLVHPLFTLGGLPRVAAAQPFSASTGLRRFVQFALVPLTALYLVILYLYAGKIAVVGELPNGWVGLPVLILTVVGILSALLLHPWAADATTKWVRHFTRGFFALTLPLTGLLALSIAVRIADYGVTESRYYVVLLTGWLVVVCLIRTKQPHRDLRLIPASLLVLCLIASFGPWGATAWSLRSQTARAETLVAALNLRDADGNLHAFTAIGASEETLAQADSLSDTLRYLNSRHGFAEVPASLRADHGNIHDLISDLALRPFNARTASQVYLATQSSNRLRVPFPAEVVEVRAWEQKGHLMLRHLGWVLTNTGELLQLRSPDGATAVLTATQIRDAANLSQSPYKPEDLTFDFTFADGRRARIAFFNVTLEEAPAIAPRIIVANFLIALPL